MLGAAYDGAGRCPVFLEAYRNAWVRSSRICSGVPLKRVEDGGGAASALEAQLARRKL